MQFGIEENPELLAKFIGPPLLDSFQKHHSVDHKQALKAIALYGEYFHAHGLKN